MNMLKIVSIGKEKLNSIKDLAYKIWPDAYGKILSEAQLNYMLDNFYSVENLANQMDNGQVFELLFEENKEVGFVAYEINCKDTGLLKIHKIYLLPETQGKGFGKFMIDEVLKIAKKYNQKGVFLNVNKYNKAKLFYEKLGFVVVKDEVIDIGNNYVMDDYVMTLLF